MRLLKFRAWDVYNKRMLIGDQLEETENIIYSMDYGELNLAWVDHNGDYNDVIPMQFTGLYDKNGKEIYEHDRIAFIAIEDERKGHYSEATGTVRWNSEDAGFYIENDNDKFPHVKLWFAKDIKVMGNIYEHPELLKT